MSRVFWCFGQWGNTREVGTSIGIIYEVSTERLLEEGKSYKGRELPSLSPQSLLFLLQLLPHRLNTAHLEQSTAAATNGFIFQVTDSSLQSMGIRLTWLECKRFLNWFSCEIMSS